MKKQKLLKLPVMPRRQVYPDKRKAYEAAVHEETVDGESVLVIELYYSRNDEVTYRIFLGQTDYVTCKLLGKEEQWTHKDIGELIGEIWVNGVGRTIKTEVYTFPEDVEKIKRFTGFTGNHVENIQEYQEKLRKEQRIRRDKKVTDVWDEEIGVLPPCRMILKTSVGKRQWKSIISSTQRKKRVTGDTASTAAGKIPWRKYGRIPGESAATVERGYGMSVSTDGTGGDSAGMCG